MYERGTQHSSYGERQRGKVDKYLPAATGDNGGRNDHETKKYSYYCCNVHSIAISLILVSVSGTKEMQAAAEK